MRVLLDTHAFLWFILNDPRLVTRDPFDRLLVAQALSEGISIVSSDAALDPYGVARLW